MIGDHNIEEGTSIPLLTNPAVAKDILEGKQIIDKNGNILVGSIKPYPDDKYSILPTTLPHTIPTEIMYLASNIIIQKDPNLLAQNIVKGKSIFGVAGRYGMEIEENSNVTISSSYPEVQLYADIIARDDGSTVSNIKKFNISQSIPNICTSNTVFGICLGNCAKTANDLIIFYREGTSIQYIILVSGKFYTFIANDTTFKSNAMGLYSNTRGIDNTFIYRLYRFNLGG